MVRHGREEKRDTSRLSLFPNSLCNLVQCLVFINIFHCFAEKQQHHGLVKKIYTKFGWSTRLIPQVNVVSTYYSDPLQPSTTHLQGNGSLLSRKLHLQICSPFTVNRRNCGDTLTYDVTFSIFKMHLTLQSVF